MKKKNNNWGGYREESKLIKKLHKKWKRSYPNFIKRVKKT